MTQDEFWAKEQRKFDAETGGPFVTPPWLKQSEKKEEEAPHEEEPDANEQRPGKCKPGHQVDTR